MKKRLIGLLLCIVMIVTAIPMLALADDDAPALDLGEVLTEKKFNDVTDTSWYAEGVYYCVEAGFMSGTSDSLFTPHASMTRAMFVTMLAAYDGADLSNYSGTSFADVAAGKWYSTAVEWAYKNGIVSGIGEGTFGYKNTVNRQEIALMLKTYLEYKGQDTTAEESFKFSRYADKDDISSWAEGAMAWACGMGLFDAAGNEGDLPILKPKNTATRAQVALIMMNFDQALNAEAPKLTIAGNDISLYSIVIAENTGIAAKKDPIKKASEYLQGWIRDAYGVEVPIVKDSTEPTEYEIVMGKTNREDMGLVTVEREAEYELYYSVNVQANRLVIAGVVDADNRRGTLYGAYDVAEVIGYSFLADNMVLFDGESHDIPADFDITDAPGFEYRVVYWPGGWSEVYNNDEDYYPGCNVMVHELAMWVDPSLDPNNGGYRAPCPCLTDEENIQKIIDKVFYYIGKSPNATSIWVSQPDTWDHCECARCMEMYDANGGNHSATIINLCNIICEKLDEAGYTDFKVLTLAYDYSTAPPTNMVCDDDIIVYYCTIWNCMSCPYESTTCPHNAGIAAEIEKWGEICEKLYVWDYSTNFSYLTVPYPDFYNIRENNEWFYENGVRGVFNNAVASETGEFGSLRAYLYSAVYRDPNMSEEEYFAKMDEFLAAYYGSGWKNIRKFIDLMEEWSSKYHFTCRLEPDYFYDLKYFESGEDMLNALWDEAEAMADSQWQLENIQRSRLCCTYMILNATYYKDCQMGTSETRAAWRAQAQQFYDEIVACRAEWAENFSSPKLNLNKPPMEWQ